MSLNVIIVGGSRGIGFAIAKKFMQHSYNVTLVSRNEENLKKSAQTLKKFASENQINNLVEYHICDVSIESDITQTCQNLINSFNERSEKIDVLINSAGITLDKLLLSTKNEAIHDVLNTNLLSTILFSKFLSRQMIKQKKGSIVNIGSIVGLNGNAGQTIYSASKSGLIGFTKSLAKELGSKNITVNLISPGFIKTDMTSTNVIQKQIAGLMERIPLERVGLPEEVANAAYFIGTSSYITGSILSVDGGLSLAL